MKYFSMFTGIGGFEKGIEDAIKESRESKYLEGNPNIPIIKGQHQKQQSTENWECVGYSEIDKYANAIYRYHYPNSKNYGDATTELFLMNCPTLTVSLGDFLARVSVLLEKEKPFQTLEERSFLKSAESLKLKNLRIFGLKMLKDYYLLHIQKLSKNGTKQTLMKMENLPNPLKKNINKSQVLKDGFFSQYSTHFGNWGMTVNGKCLTANIMEYHKIGKECSLSQILETDVDPKYFLSEKSIQGILRANTMIQTGKYPEQSQLDLEKESGIQNLGL